MAIPVACRVSVCAVGPGFAAASTHPALLCWTSFSLCWLVSSVRCLLSRLEPVWWVPAGDWMCVWNRHLSLPLQMGSAQHPDVTLVEVLQRVTFPLYLSLLMCSSFPCREVSQLLEICPLFSTPLQRHCHHNTQATCADT